MEGASKVRKVAKNKEKVPEGKSVKRQKTKQEPQQTRKKRCSRATLKERNRDASPIKKRADFAKMVEIFNKVQHLKNHDDCLKELCQIHQSSSHRDFCAKLVQLIKAFIRNDSKSPYTKNCIAFVPKLINTLDNRKRLGPVKENETPDDLGESIFGEEAYMESISSKECMLDYVLSGLLEEINSPSTNIRLNVCTLLRWLLSAVSDIQRDLYLRLQEELLQRFKDRNFSVRMVAAFALKRFQDPFNENCKIVKAYVFHITRDPAFQVRYAALQCVEINSISIESVIKKIRDMKNIIRKAAFTKIADHVDMHTLRQDQRIYILREGLSERAYLVRRYVQEGLLCAWLKGCDNDLFKFVTYLGLKSTSTTEKALKIIFEHFLMIKDEKFGTKLHSYVREFRDKYLDDKKLLVVNYLNEVTTFIWRNLNTFIKSNEDKFIRFAGKQFLSDSESAELSISKIQTHEQKEDLNKILDDWANLSLKEGQEKFPQNDSQYLDFLLPELPYLCQYLEEFVQKIESSDLVERDLAREEFLYNQFICLLMIYDVGDDAQANYLFDLIRKILFSPSLHMKLEKSIAPLMNFIAKKVFQDPSNLLEFAADYTSKVYNRAVEMNGCSDPSQITALDTDPLKEFDSEYSRVSTLIEELRLMLNETDTNDEDRAADLKAQLDDLCQKRDEYLRLKQKFNEADIRSSPRLTNSQTLAPSQNFDINNHPEVLLKCVEIFVSCLEYGNFTHSNSIIISHIDKILLPGLQSRDARIRGTCIKGMGLSCLLSETLFRQYANLLLQAVIHDKEEIKIIALCSFFDCLCTHGLKPLLQKASDGANKRRMSKIEEELANITINHLREISMVSDELGSLVDPELEKTLCEAQSETEVSQIDRTFFELMKPGSEAEIIQSLISLLTETFLDRDLDPIGPTSIEGFAKLMLLGVIYSPELLSRYIMVWYLPSTSPKVIQFLGIFLPHYITSAARYRTESENVQVTGQTALIECFIETLEILYEAKNSANRDPDELKIIDYLPFLRNDEDRIADFRRIDLKHVMNFMLTFTAEKYNALLFESILQHMHKLISQGPESFRYYSNFFVEISLPACMELKICDMEIEKRQEIQRVIESIIFNLTNMRGMRKDKSERFVRSLRFISKRLHRPSDPPPPEHLTEHEPS